MNACQNYRGETLEKVPPLVIVHTYASCYPIHICICYPLFNHFFNVAKKAVALIGRAGCEIQSLWIGMGNIAFYGP